MFADHDIRIDHRPSHHHRSLADPRRGRDDGGGMNGRPELAGQSLHYFFPNLIEPDAHDHRTQPRSIMQDLSPRPFIYVRIIIHKSFDRFSPGRQYFLDHFPVAACSEQIHRCLVMSIEYFHCCMAVPIDIITKQHFFDSNEEHFHIHHEPDMIDVIHVILEFFCP